MYTLTHLDVVPVRQTAPRKYAYGSRVPLSLAQLARRFDRLTADPRARCHPADLLDELRRPLNPGTTVYAATPNTALYSPVGYSSLALAVIARVRPDEYGRP